MIKNTLILIFCFSYINVSAQSGGKSVFDFLKLPVSSRVSALGGVAPIFDNRDINLSAANPALISTKIDNQITFNFLNYISDINGGYFGYSKSFEKHGSFLVGIQFVNYGDFILSEPSGEITGQFTAADYSFNLGWGIRLDSNFSMGINHKFIYSHLEQYISTGSALDFSGIYSIPQQDINLSLIFNNIGYLFNTYMGQRDRLPFNIQFAFSKRLKHAPLRFSVIADNLNQYKLTYTDPSVPTINSITGEAIEQENLFFDNLLRHIVFSTEILPTKNFQIQIGYNYKRRKEMYLESRPGLAGLSFGTAVKISKFNINYSRAIYHIAGASNHISISTNLSFLSNNKFND